MDTFSKKNNQSIQKKLNEKNKLIIFYDYYESICPKGELHQFKSNNQKDNNCIKCGINDVIRNSLSKVFYNKYISTYTKTKEKKQEILNEFITNHSKISISNSENIKYKKEVIKKWSFSTDFIKKLSNIFNINYNIWSNLGSSYKYDFEQIEKKKINPINDISNIYDIKFRCSTVKSYIKFMPIILNTILNYNIINFVPYDLKKILDKNKVLNMDKKINLSSFIKNFNKEYSEYSLVEKPEILYNYLLNNLSKYLMDLYNELNKNKVNISREIISYIIDSIIQSEKNFSKIDINKYKTTINKIDDIMENKNTQLADGSDDENDNMNDPDPDNDVDNDIFSRDSIDMESEGKEGDDDAVNADF
jgi:hypothetical protein